MWKTTLKLLFHFSTDPTTTATTINILIYENYRKELLTMKFKCSREKLLNGINIVSKIVPARTTMPILECILVTADDTGIKLMANDTEIGIETSAIEADIEETGTFAFESKIFSEIIRSLPSNEVSLETDEKFLTKIKSGNSEFKIMGFNGNDFPPLPTVEKENKFEIEESKLKNIIKRTIFSVAAESSKIVLTGELLKIKNSSLEAVAIDGYRISYRTCKVGENSNDNEAIVPAKALNELSRILTDKGDGRISVYYTKNHIVFETESLIMVSRLIEGEFLKYEQIFANENTTSIEINTEEFLSAIERASLFSKENKKSPVKFNITPERLIITSNTELGESYDELDIVHEGESLEIAFNPRYLTEALKAVEDDKVQVQFMSNLSPCIIKPIKGENYKYLILPLRIKG